MHTVLFELELIRPGAVKAPKVTVPVINQVSFQKAHGNDTHTVKKDVTISSSVTNAVNGVPGAVSMDRRGSQGLRSMLLKGQMRFIKEIDSIIFLCSPM